MVLGKITKEIWKTLNYLLNNKHKSISNNFRIDGVTTDDKTVISNKFCELFVNNPKRYTITLKCLRMST